MIEKFKQYLQVNGMSYSTIKNYIIGITLFLNQVKIEDISEENICKFLLNLQQKYNNATCNVYRASIKSFLAFIKKDIPIPRQLKIDAKIPKCINERYFEKEIIPVIECVYYKPLKLKAVLYFMFYTGIRVSEINYIKREDFDFKQRRVKIYVKKRKEERLVCFTEKVSNIIQSYFNSEPQENNAFNITSITLQKTFSRLKYHFKNINFHCHMFRHSYALNLLSKGVDLAIVSKLLGHRSISSTMRYLRLDIDIIQKAYDKHIK